VSLLEPTRRTNNLANHIIEPTSHAIERAMKRFGFKSSYMAAKFLTTAMIGDEKNYSAAYVKPKWWPRYKHWQCVRMPLDDKHERMYINEFEFKGQTYRVVMIVAPSDKREGVYRIVTCWKFEGTKMPHLWEKE
jgi:hypothetical protein